MQNSPLSRQEAASLLLKRRQARRSLIDFTSYTNHKYVTAEHHRVIASALDDVLAGKIDRLQLRIPPRHGKSELASRRFPAYALGINPDWQVISASATSTLAEDFGRDVRNLMRGQEYSSLFSTRLSDDSQARGRWSTDAGGVYYAIGVGGSIMGRGGDLIVIDDPFSSWEDAQSELSRKNVWDWYTNTIYNRLQPGGRIVVINHRMHEDDLCGRLDYDEGRGGDKWHRISLPAIAGNGVALWPERYPIDALERIKRTMAPRGWSALYQQDPTADEGTYFSRANFQVYRQPPQFLNTYITGDFAVSEDKGDYTDIIVWGVDQYKRIYILDSWYGQKTAKEWIGALLDLVEQYEPKGFVAEGGVIRRAIEPFLEEAMVQRGVFVTPHWLPTTADKPAMARSFQGLTEAGRVYVPDNEKGERIVDQCVRFPGGRYDDAVDACSVFGRFIYRTWQAEGEKESPQTLEQAWNAPMTFGQAINGT